MALPFKIIGKLDFEGVAKIATNLNDKDLNPKINDAQNFELMKLMGDDFYYYFLSFFTADRTLDPDAPQQIKDLYNGSTYSHKGYTRNNPGIKPVVVQFTISQLISGLDQHITPTGYMNKLNEYSERVSQQQRSYDNTVAQNKAIAYWNLVLKYIESEKEFFKDYLKGCGCGIKNGGVRPKMVNIEGEELGNSYSRRIRRINL